MQRRLFEEINWSTERVFEQTVQRAKESELPMEFLPTWYDVDDRATLRRLCDDLLGDTAAPSSAGYARPRPNNFWSGSSRAKGVIEFGPQTHQNEQHTKQTGPRHWRRRLDRVASGGPARPRRLARAHAR